ncbi:NifB/NifX family molybdenum-iron cluster-binding protein [Caldisalinibacter kiritimatiensis]|uniref:Dinitrogenase iron-molybdenum cofactor biosynthesis n=1 Tax=Caldisalinibacter kiritimatiensis TaxID=1304284 RepID=R1CDL7_9FIRM|nr:NifB/NifX family molybdenum-iron cluster-binding protein [Caldisalinibacter kiritimatiensis]EOD00385.1 Dinitrogenase iron-molybdenum cofactor biosynthesis [Caldisalinibacter kiritimatiensis]
MNLIIACATDNGEEFVNRHFGDANFYDIYSVSKEGWEYIKRVTNTTEEEEHEDEVHGDPKKAKGISQILKKHDVQVLVSRQFGLNITRVKKKFVPVVIRAKDVEEGLKLVKDHLDIIVEEYNKVEERQHIILKNRSELDEKVC